MAAWNKRQLNPIWTTVAKSDKPLSHSRQESAPETVRLWVSELSLFFVFFFKCKKRLYDLISIVVLDYNSGGHLTLLLCVLFQSLYWRCIIRLQWMKYKNWERYGAHGKRCARKTAFRTNLQFQVEVTRSCATHIIQYFKIIRATCC